MSNSNSILNKGLGAKYRWLYPVFGMAMGLFIVFSNIMSQFYPYLQAQYNVETVATFALAASLMGGGDMLVGPLLNMLFFDKYGPKFMYTGTVICMVVALFCMRAVGAGTVWDDSAMFWYIGSFMLGVGAGLRSGTAPALANKWCPDNPGFATGLVAMGQGLAAFWMAPTVAFLIPNYGFGDAWTILITLGIVVVILTGIIPQRQPEPDFKPEGWEPPVKDEAADDGSLTLSQAIKTKEYWVLFICTFLVSFANFAIVMNVVPMYIEGLGQVGFDAAYVTTNITAVMLSATSVLNAAGRPIWGFIRDRIKNTWITLLLLYGGAAIAIFAMSILYKTGVVPAIAIGCVVYFFLSGTSPVHMSAGPVLFGPKYAGSILSSTLYGTGFAWLLGPYIGATIKDMTGAYTNCFYLAIATCVIAILLVIYIYNVQKKKERAAA